VAFYPFVVSAVALSFGVQHGQAAAPQGQHGMHRPDEPGGCAEPTLTCATFATPAFAPDGALWVVWAGAGQIRVARSTDLGQTFAAPIAITKAPETLDVGADARPQIVIDRRGRILVAYAVMRGDRYVGQVLVSRSEDGGATFTAPQPISENPASQRFVNLAPDANDRVLATWIDKRQVVAAERDGKPFAGASLAMAWSEDGGRTFTPAEIAHDHMCECCRLAVVFAAPGRPILALRGIFDGERDHAVITFGGRGAAPAVARVSEDHWKIDACPHHGPSLAMSSNGAVHVAWLSGGGVRRGLFYARSSDGRSFSTPLPIGDPKRQPTRPFVFADGGRLWLAWKEFDGTRASVQVMGSSDGGRTWSSPNTVAATLGFSDHPLLVGKGGRVFLSWLTRAEGYRLLPVDEPRS
jgi:hypothetical protein